MSERPLLAVDIGGTKIAVAAATAEGELARHAELATPLPPADGEAVWRALGAATDAVLDGVAPRAVGIGCGGPMRLDLGLVSPLNIPAWRDFPLLGRLTERFPDAPIALRNDAVAMAVAEFRRGSGRGCRAFLGVVVSTGVGGGLILDGRVVEGETGNAGHLGHVVVDPAGPPCACGGIGCLEAVARGPAVVQWAVDHGWRAEGAARDGRSLAAAARAGDRVARQAIERAGDALGVALASTAHLLELERVAVGGGLGTGAGELLLAPARAAFARHAVMGFAARCEIVAAELGAASGLLGAAELARQAAAREWSVR